MALVRDPSYSGGVTSRGHQKIMRGNVASIQVLRFVAATLVVMFHTTVALNKYFVGSLSPTFLSSAVFGASGVHIFFVISGFIMVYTSFNTKTDEFKSSKFAIKRLIRIYPIYFIYSIFYLYFYATFAGGKGLSVEQFFGSMLLFPGYSALIIGPGWTLSYEVYFYLCFGIAMMFGVTRGMLGLTLFFVAAIAARIVLDTHNPVVHVITSSLLIEFLFGAWIGYAVISNVPVGNKVANLMLLVSVAVFGAGIAFGYTRLPSMLTWGIPSALLVAGLVFRESNGGIPSIIKKYTFLGDSSYSLYLLHIVLIDVVMFVALGVFQSVTKHVFQIGPIGMMAVCLTIAAYCIAVSLVSYQLIERRMLYHLHSIFKRKTASTIGKQRVG